MGGFREFLTRSNALALAIGVIIGASLGAVVNSLVNDIIMPPIGWALGGVDFAQLKIVLGTAKDGTEVAISYGLFINAVIVFIEPTITVRPNGVALPTPFTCSRRPAGSDRIHNRTVCGSKTIVFDADRPHESVAVNVSCNDDGYSWSGATNEPVLPVPTVPMSCSWQFDGQWSITRLHSRADPPSAPSSVSVARPARSIVSPTYQRCDAEGVSIAGLGGVSPG